MMVVMEALGEALVVEPYLATVGLGGRFVARAGSPAQQERVLPALTEGKHDAGLRPDRGRRALRPAPRSACRRGRPATASVLDGDKTVVLHGGCADLLVVSARTAGGDADAAGITPLPRRTRRRPA